MPGTQSIREPGHQTVIAEWGYRLLKTVAAARPFIGDFWEEATASLLPGSRRLNINSNCASCTDLIYKNKHVEVKSVGRSGRALLFSKNIQAADPNTIFVFWCHKTRIAPTNIYQLRRDLAANLNAVVIASHTHVFARCLSLALRDINHRGPRAGGSFTAMPGWSLPINYLRGGMPKRVISLRSVYGVDLPPVTLHGELP